MRLLLFVFPYSQDNNLTELFQEELRMFPMFAQVSSDGGSWFLLLRFLGFFSLKFYILLWFHLPNLNKPIEWHSNRHTHIPRAGKSSSWGGKGGRGSVTAPRKNPLELIPWMQSWRLLPIAAFPASQSPSAPGNVHYNLLLGIKISGIIICSCSLFIPGFGRTE